MVDKISGLNDVIWKSTVINYYKQKHVQEAIVRHSSNREVVGSFGGKGYAKRPDIIQYPNDVFALVARGVTSFHASEELWSNPLLIQTGMKPSQANDLRIGWDLVLDIDCPFWKLSKIAAMLQMEALKRHRITCASIKFSGNKGFHLGIPYEAFPKQINGRPTSEFFPDAPRRIAAYLLHYIEDQKNKLIKITDDAIYFLDEKILIEDLKKITGKGFDELTYNICNRCHKKISGNARSKNKYIYECKSCGLVTESFNDSYVACPECGAKLTKTQTTGSICSCGSNDIDGPFFDTTSIIEVDTILISSRHLYRMPFSLHEKSGLASIPIDPDKIMQFEKDQADPKKITPNITKRDFLKINNNSPSDNDITNQANNLFNLALEHTFNLGKITEEKQEKALQKEFEEFKAPESAIPQDYFAPCIKNMLKGIKDGRKRALFILTNYLSSLGWDYAKIRKELLEWNKNNPEPLKEVVINGHLRYHMKKGKVMPPNCDNEMYYKGILVCDPDRLCERIKNPVQYSRRKIYFIVNDKRFKDKNNNSKTVKK